MTLALLSLLKCSDWLLWLTNTIGHLQGILALESWAILLVSLVKFKRSLRFQVNISLNEGNFSEAVQHSLDDISL